MITAYGCDDLVAGICLSVESQLHVRCNLVTSEYVILFLVCCRPLDPMILDQSYIRLKSDVTLAERRVLKELGFCVHVKHPHKVSHIITFFAYFLCLSQ
jgi:hypothetical protein